MKTETYKTENTTEEYKVVGKDVLAKVREIIDKGIARKIIIKNENGAEIMSIPLTLGAVGVIFAPVLAAVGALAALISKCTIVVENR